MGLLITVIVVVVLMFLAIYAERVAVKDPMLLNVLIVATVVVAFLVILLKSGLAVGL